MQAEPRDIASTPPQDAGECNDAIVYPDLYRRNRREDPVS